MEIPSILKYTFLLHFIACLILGLIFFLSPEIYVDVTAWPFLDPYAGRIMGSMFIGFAITGYLGYKASSWEEVRILVYADITWAILASISMIWMIIAYPSAPILVSGFDLLLGVLFMILFLYSYFQVKKAM